MKPTIPQTEVYRGRPLTVELFDKMAAYFAARPLLPREEVLSPRQMAELHELCPERFPPVPGYTPRKPAYAHRVALPRHLLAPWSPF